MRDTDKQILRKYYKTIRSNIIDRPKKDQAIFKQVINNCLIQDSSLILIYFSTKDEVDTKELIKFFLSSHKSVALPKVVDQAIIFYYITSINDVKTGRFGIKEPISDNKVSDYSNSVCIVPGICFDKNNYRIGYGGGYYDRFLKHYKGYKIGITYSECVVNEIAVESHDIQLDMVISSSNY